MSNGISMCVCGVFERVVHRGAVVVNGGHYYSEALNALNGQVVKVRYELEIRQVEVLTVKGAEICCAVLAPRPLNTAKVNHVPSC